MGVGRNVGEMSTKVGFLRGECFDRPLAGRSFKPRGKKPPTGRIPRREKGKFWEKREELKLAG